MVHFFITETSEKSERAIIEKHLNEMLRSVCGFMIAMVPGLVPESSVPEFIRNDPLVKNPEWALPVSWRTPLNKRIYFRSLLIKVFDELDYFDLTMDERYVIAKILDAGIRREEAVMERFAEKGADDRLKYWLEKYRIRGEERATIERLTSRSGETSVIVSDYLSEKDEAFRESVIRLTGGTKLLDFEYPIALMRLFNKEDWYQLMAQQEFEDLMEKREAKKEEPEEEPSDDVFSEENSKKLKKLPNST